MAIYSIVDFTQQLTQHNYTSNWET